MLRRQLPLIAVLVLLAACTTAKGDPTGAATADATVASEPSITASPLEGEHSAVGVGGTVQDVSPSARVITLREASNGFSVIALTESTELTFADGREAALRDIAPGMAVKASGQPGAADALLADRVLVLDATPAPFSD